MTKKEITMTNLLFTFDSVDVILSHLSDLFKTGQVELIEEEQVVRVSSFMFKSFEPIFVQKESSIDIPLSNFEVYLKVGESQVPVGAMEMWDFGRRLFVQKDEYLLLKIIESIVNVLEVDTVFNQLV